MAKVAVTHKFDAAAEDVWALVGGFHTLPNWHPAAVRSTDQSDGNDIVRDLELKRPIFRKTAAYGHFGRTEPTFTWEKTDFAEELAQHAS